MKKIAAILAVIISAFHWEDFLWRPFEEKGKPFEIFMRLLTPINTIYPMPFGGWLLLAAWGTIISVFFLAGRWLNAYWVHCFVPITVLETNLTLKLEKDGVTSSLKREQLYYANQPKQRAYHASSSVNNSEGAIEGIEIQSFINDVCITEQPALTFGNNKKKDIIESYVRDLPINPFVSLLPNGLVLFLYRQGFFQNLIVKRKATYLNKNEYNGAIAQFSLTSIRYPVTNVRIVFDFPEELAPKAADMNIYLIEENVAKRKVLEDRSENGWTSYSVVQDNFRKSTIRAYWLPVRSRK